MRGKPDYAATSAEGGGSPPRVRGKHPACDKREGSGRITPACAGKTERYQYAMYSWKDHPRVCGENCKPYHAAYFVKGSPPRVRGKLHVDSASRRAVRITPACAGKTHASTRSKLLVEDHPRVCGENPFLIFASKVFIGSPPRVRGKPVVCRRKHLPERITPACAGKTNLNSCLQCEH